MKNYADFIKDHHLKIDTDTDLFSAKNGAKMVTVGKLKDLKKT